MTKTKTENKIQISEIFKESFCHLCEHKMDWIRVAFAPVVLFLIGAAIFVGCLYFGGVTFSEDYALQYPEGGFLAPLGSVIFYISYYVAPMMLYINGYRYGVLKERGDHWWTLQFNWRLVKFILYTILVGIIIAIPVFLGGLAGYFAGENVFIGAIVALPFIVVSVYWLIRFILTLVNVSLDIYKPLRSSWRMTSGNVWRLIGLFVLLSLAIAAAAVVGTVILGLIGYVLSFISNWFSEFIAFVIVLFFLFIWFVSWVVFTKALSLVYMTLKKKA